MLLLQKNQCRLYAHLQLRAHMCIAIPARSRKLIANVAVVVAIEVIENVEREGGGLPKDVCNIAN